MGLKCASTAVGAHNARIVVGLQCASTAVGARDARIAVGLESASTAVNNMDARIAVGLESASMAANAHDARIVVGHNVALLQNGSPVALPLVRCVAEQMPKTIGRDAKHASSGFAPSPVAKVV